MIRNFTCNKFDITSNEGLALASKMLDLYATKYNAFNEKQEICITWKPHRQGRYVSFCQRRKKYIWDNIQVIGV